MLACSVALISLSAGFTAPPSLARPLSAGFTVAPRSSSPVAGWNPFKKKSGGGGGGGSGGDLASINHEDAAEIVLTGGQRRTLRAKGKSLKPFPVADIPSAVSDVNEKLSDELIKCKFTSTDKKPDAQLEANELAAQVGAAVAECIGNECLLYRPPPAGKRRKYAI